MSESQPLSGWRRWWHLKLRFGLSKLPLFPVRYRLRTSGRPDVFFRWSKVIPFMDSVRGAFDFELYGWDVRELRFLRRFLRPGMTFIDIGAHHGLYAVLAAHCVTKRGRVLACEPSPSIYARLRWHCRLNQANDVLALQVALGADGGMATLFVPTKGLDTISSLRSSNAGANGIRGVTVQLTTLDELTRRHEISSLEVIKVDVEGAEAEVLQGAGETLGRYAPIWLFEALDCTAAAWGGTGRALVQRFVALDHEIYEFTEQGWLQPHLARHDYPLDSNCNLLAVPKVKREVVKSLITPAE